MSEHSPFHYLLDRVFFSLCLITLFCVIILDVCKTSLLKWVQSPDRLLTLRRERREEKSLKGYRSCLTPPLNRANNTVSNTANYRINIMETLGQWVAQPQSHPAWTVCV